MRARVIPVLLVEEGSLVKTIKFNKRVYLGDPINTVRLFNDMEVDELLVLDISATRNSSGPNYSLIEEIRNEAFMPLGYGGGIKNSQETKNLINMGIEKVVINSACFSAEPIIEETSSLIGSQSVVASLDIKKTAFGQYKVYSYLTEKILDLKLNDFLEELAYKGVGEIFLNNVHKDGTWMGYDLEIIKRVSDLIKVPIVACGGSGSLDNIKQVIEAGASAAAAGSLFSFQGKGMGVLTNYPDPETLDNLFNE
tara:strand:+ start:15556 stop:16314 length:759 start_codon:yes stop_codon:yes gene_type:complete